MKKLQTILILLLAVTVLTGCTVSAAMMPEETSIAELTETAAPTEPEKLTPEAARAIALAEAGLTPEAVTDLWVKFDIDSGTPEYEVDFRSGDYEYSYDIHAVTGAIRSRGKEYDPIVTEPPVTEPAPTEPVQPAPAPTEPPKAAAQPETITADRAVAIALARAGLRRADVTRLEVEYEVDDGVPEYEVEFHHGRTEYDFEIHAVTGKILDFDTDIDD